MHLKNKLKDISHYIKAEYPDLDFDYVSVSDSCARNICKIIFKNENNNVLKKSIVNALKKKGSSLRKLIETDTTNDQINVKMY